MKLVIGILLGMFLAMGSSYIDAAYMPMHHGWWCDIQNHYNAQIVYKLSN